MESYKILLPLMHVNSKQTFLKGYLTYEDYCNHCTIYFTELFESQECLEKQLSADEDTTVIGCISKNPLALKAINKICLCNYIDPAVTELIINGKVIIGGKFIFIFYDINKVINSETLDVSCNDLMCIRELVKRQSNIPQTTSYAPKLKAPSILSSSMIIQHLFNYMNLLNWLKDTVRKKEKVSTVIFLLI